MLDILLSRHNLQTVGRNSNFIELMLISQYGNWVILKHIVLMSLIEA